MTGTEFITIKEGSEPVIHWTSVEKIDHKSQKYVDYEVKRTGASFFLAMLLLLPATGVLAGTFRWVDDNGKVHYTDQVPPEESKRPHAKLSPSAQTIELVEGQKTPEQFEQIKRLKQLRIDQQKVLTLQKDSDSSLLRTYRSVEEMEMALQNKINTMDSTIKIAESNRQHQEENLKSQVKRASEMELSSQPVPKNLRDNIEATRRQIATYIEKIRILEVSKQDILKAFEKDLERFKSLENIRNHPELGSNEWRSQGSNVDVGVLSMISCKPMACNLAWSLAKDYVKSRTNKPFVAETDTIMQTASPRDEKDLAILVVRISGKTSETIFLDTSCHASSLGDEFCLSETTKNARAGFVPYVQNGLKMAGH